MKSLDFLLQILIMLYIVSFSGYLFSVLKEKIDLYNNRIEIKSNTLTQEVIDELDLKFFKLGNINLNIGDEIKINLRNNKSVNGIVLGAKKCTNSLFILTFEDKVLELNAAKIKGLKIVKKYGRLL